MSGMNKKALASLGYQERRLREMQSLLRSSPSCQTQPTVGEDGANTDVGTCNQTIPTNNDSSLIEMTGEQTTSTIIDTSSKTSPVTCVPDAPRNFTATEITPDSFTVVWDDFRSDEAIIDYEIRYSHLVQGKQIEAFLSCSRWCLKRPLPAGRFVVHNLAPATEYHNIAIRCRNALGWSNFSDPVKCLTTPAQGEGSFVTYYTCVDHRPH